MVNWIKGAVKNPGALKAYAKRHHESTKRAVKVGLKSKNPTLHKRAVLARTFQRMAKNRSKKGR